ncbi:MAG TPA: periplasmic heavy metal sensor [Aquabacterium sp.]|uniref:Spy/CpxP family protein refolding chaperone n=1 Tax=Aquabacterium sp. TaxID=1872578 RepID=UPI002E307CA5|nr:periplasmic heavy metal sensor [Aquabacterium sp.]HEX5356140.1 periplasmic heavy metal sensor [Aquabacterium sp.]
MNEIQSPTSATAGRTSHKQRWALGALIATTTASVVLSISAWAGGDEPASRMPPHGMGVMGACGADMGGMPGGMPFGGRHLQRLLDDAKVSEVQRTQIQQIVDKAQSDLKALFDEGKGLHEQGLKLWAAPRIDAAAAEKLRQQMQAHHDKVSKRMLQAMLDVGNVLTPEQRTVVASQLEKRHEDMMRHMQGHRHGGPGKSGGASERQPEGQ